MNLKEMWGYCIEEKHRLLVREYMKHENLLSNALDWKKRFEIAVGTAKSLAYLHEECLEWVLHCDVKPQNILLESNNQPKVANFGLSKLLKRGRRLIVASRESWIEEIIDPGMDDKYDMAKMELLARVALQCVAED
uniref:Protein kinase domain-containing protein n=1 Tax=Fagus sylvatica TaxID=28930 RepID=A0A2N9E616_FAGSY